MHFCDKCDNMLYIRLLEENSHSLVYYCRKCGDSDKIIDKDNICVSRTELVTQDRAYINDINQYTKYDPTLPHVTNMQCANSECKSNKDPSIDPDITYVRYDESKMKYIYLCCICDKAWIHPEYQKTTFIKAS